jgi:hypothetical protein
MRVIEQSLAERNFRPRDAGFRNESCLNKSINNRLDGRENTAESSKASDPGEQGMERKIAAMIGAAALAAAGSTQVAAAPDPERLLQASSFAELLQPIPNARAVLAAAAARGASGPSSEPEDRDTRQMMAYYHHHHHHHHHHRWSRHRHHHHHHHHHW